MKLIFFVIACLSIVSLTLGSAIRDSKAIEDRLNLKRKFQLKTKQELEKPKPQEDEIEPIDQAADDKEDSAPGDNSSTTSIPEVSSTVASTSTSKALLPKPRPTTKPNNGRLIKTTTETFEDEETTTKTPKPIRKPAEGPKQIPVIKPFDAARRQNLAGNPSRPRPNTVVSVKPFKNLLAARLGANAKKEAPAVVETSTINSSPTVESVSDIFETTTKKPLRSRLLG